MKNSIRLKSLVACVALLTVCMAGCAKKIKKGQVVVKDYKFVIRQDSQHLYAVDAEGIVKNVGKYDVKKIVVTGYCPSCQQEMVEGKWMVSDVPKTPDEEATIRYLAPGAEAPFKFKNIATMLYKNGDKTSIKLPNKLVVKIVSFETVQQ